MAPNIISISSSNASRYRGSCRGSRHIVENIVAVAAGRQDVAVAVGVGHHPDRLLERLRPVEPCAEAGGHLRNEMTARHVERGREGLSCVIMISWLTSVTTSPDPNTRNSVDGPDTFQSVHKHPVPRPCTQILACQIPLAHCVHTALSPS